MTSQKKSAPAGDSGTPLGKKLGIKEGYTVAFLGAPASFKGDLGTLPDGVKVGSTLKGKAPLDVVVYFAKSAAALSADFGKIKDRLDSAGGFWVAWPKKASKVPTDVTENLVRELGLARGLVDNKVCAIDENWSGLRLVYRLKDR